MSDSAEVRTITRAEAEKALGAHPQQMQRLLDRGWFPTVERDGKTLLVREGLEERWRTRPRQRVKPPASPAPAATTHQPRPRPRNEANAANPVDLAEWSLPEIPDQPVLEEQKGWTEFTKRYREQLALLKEAEILVYKADVEAAQAAISMQLLTRAQSIPIQYKSRFPETTDRQMQELERLVLTIFEDTASDSFDELAR